MKDKSDTAIATAKPLVVEYTYNATPEKIWKALTQPAEMKKWYFDLPGFQAKKGHIFQFEGGPPEKSYLHLCEVMEVVPKQKLMHSWRYDGYEGNSFVTFELIPKEDKTTVRLTHIGLESFPADENPDLAAGNFKTGWKDILGKSLKDYLTNGQ